MPISAAAASASAAPKGAVVPIATYVADGTTAGTTFTNIPQGYQDLMLVVSGRATRGVINDHLLMAINTDVSANYSYTYVTGDGSTTASARGTGGSFAVMFNCIGGLFAQTDATGSGVTHILNYSSASLYKTLISTAGIATTGAGHITLTTNLYKANANAVTNLYAITYTNFVAGSTMTLYGVRSAGQ